MLNINQFFEAAQLAAIAYVITNYWMRPKMILSWYWLLLDSLYLKYPNVAKPLGYCGVCFAGQLGFWFGLANYGFCTGVLMALLSSFMVVIFGKWGRIDS